MLPLDNYSKNTKLTKIIVKAQINPIIRIKLKQWIYLLL